MAVARVSITARVRRMLGGEFDHPLQVGGEVVKAELSKPFWEPGAVWRSTQIWIWRGCKFTSRTYSTRVQKEDQMWSETYGSSGEAEKM